MIQLSPAPTAPSTSTRSFLNIIATAIVVAASLLVPASVYGIAAFSNLAADMTADARVVAEVVQQEIIKAPQSWRSNTTRLQEVVSGHVHFGEDHFAEQVKIFDAQGRQVAILGPVPSTPRIVRSAPFELIDQREGRIEVERSLRPLMINGLLLALLGLVLAIGSFVTLRVIPLRELFRRNEILRRREVELALANLTLKAMTEGSLDAILVVDEYARIERRSQRDAGAHRQQIAPAGASVRRWEILGANRIC